MHDDQADYRARLEGLKSGKYDMATFTIDALIKASAELNDVPAVIVSIIDETSGADAIVGNKQTFPNVDALNRPNVQFVLTSDSPSETLARVVTNFQLNQISVRPISTHKRPGRTYKAISEFQCGRSGASLCCGTVRFPNPGKRRHAHPGR
ncbi:MAG: hypothetical protein R3C28_13535 [Pirellulaceae bacterium]